MNTLVEGVLIGFVVGLATQSPIAAGICAALYIIIEAL